jgi:Cadherin domain
LGESQNGLVKYTIVNTNNANNENSVPGMSMKGLDSDKYFDLNEMTGILTLKSELDFEIKQFYSLTIETKDCSVDGQRTRKLKCLYWTIIRRK